DAIIKVGKKILLSKVITNESREQRSELKEHRDMKAIKTLSILIGKIRKNREKNNKEKLILEEEEVLKETAQFFQNQFRSRLPKLSQMDEDWKRVYSPIEWINRSWYNDLTKPISVSK
ncbi:15929_t:CDS:2, partial [Gigaspora margarita]